MQPSGSMGKTVVLDQIRTIDKRRLVRKLGKIEGAAITEVKSVLSEMLVE